MVSTDLPGSTAFIRDEPPVGHSWPYLIILQGPALSNRAALGSDGLQERPVQRAIAGEDLLHLEPEVLTGEVRHFSAGLANQQSACRHIPGRKPSFPKAVKNPTRRIGEIERSAARSAHGASHAAES